MQQVGEHAFRQLQAVIQRHEGKGLSLTAAIDSPLQGELPENRHIAAAVQGLKPAHFLAVRQRHGRPLIATAVAVQKGPRGAPAHLQQQIPQVAFDDVDSLALLESGGELFHQLGHAGLQQFRLENGQRFCNAHGRASW